MQSHRLRLLVVLCFAAIAVPADAYGDSTGSVFHVPSPRYPTIQSAIDAARNGVMIVIATGTYTEALRIAGKSITLQGAGSGKSITLRGAGSRDVKTVRSMATVLRSPSIDLPAIAFGPGGGGILRDLAIEGGSHGIDSMGSSPPSCSPLGPAGTAPAALPLPAVAVRNVLVVGSGRGIYGSFSNLILDDVAVTRTAWNGMSILAALTQATNVVVYGAGGVGILVLNCVPQTMPLVFNGVSAFGNSFGGIEVRGNGSSVAISNSVFDFNGRAGIFLNQPGKVSIDSSIASFNTPLNDGSFGDGIDAFGNSAAVSVTIIGFSARSGIGNFGASMAISNTTFQCNAIDLDGELAYKFDFSGGGDACGCSGDFGQCQVLSSNLSPPQPIGP